MLRIYEELTNREQRTLDEMRNWAVAQGQPGEHLTSAGKLSIAQRLLDDLFNRSAVSSGEVWKVCAVGVLLGDALEQAMEHRLAWVAVEEEAEEAEDKIGSSFALSWKHSEALVYPLSAVRTRLRDGHAVDVHALFAEYSSIFQFKQR